MSFPPYSEPSQANEDLMYSMPSFGRSIETNAQLSIDDEVAKKWRTDRLISRHVQQRGWKAKGEYACWKGMVDRYIYTVNIIKKFIISRKNRYEDWFTLLICYIALVCIFWLWKLLLGFCLPRQQQEEKCHCNNTYPVSSRSRSCPFGLRKW